jgi:peroxiredoxin
MKLLTVSLFAIAAAAACSKSSSPEAKSPAPEANETAPAPATAEATPAPVEPAEPAPATLGPAPDFSLPDLTGKEVSLSEHKGKTVVLEWFNPGCPFVKYAHADGPLKDQASRLMSDDVVWIAINSGAPGKQGAGVDTNNKAAKEWGMKHAVLIDESGDVGKAYGAKTTPHMYVVSPEGELVYRGALDNAPLGNADGEVVNYVDAALEALANGQTPAVQEQKSYGCSVKYGS